MSKAYYNENEPYAAQWLRNLIAAGQIADGEVDERSIKEVTPNDLSGYTQCHFFAGIGVWSYALRRAGWPDERPVWTGSCPCQPFSSAGKKKGKADERHLWPDFFRLIRERQPITVFGEQVASQDGLAWLDDVCADLEGAGYAVGAVDFPACGVGAPHIRNRLYFVAYANSTRRQSIAHDRLGSKEGVGAQGRKGKLGEYIGNSGRLAHSARGRVKRRGRTGTRGRIEFTNGGVMGDTHHAGLQGRGERAGGVGEHGAADELADANSGRLETSNKGQWRFSVPYPTSPTNGYWANAEWLHCRDGKARPTQPGLFPLAHGLTNRVGRLRAYGNALVAPQAQAFIESFLELGYE